MSDAMTVDPTTMAIGAGTDAFNALTGLGFGIYDRIAQAKATKYQIEQDIRNFSYQAKLNQQAQANYEKNFAFQEAQANQQQDNFNKVFEANRIGNLLKEYKEAGINPAAAAGMGASTASAGVVGGTSAPNSRAGGTGISGVGTHPISELRLENTMAMLNYKLQKNLNNAQVDNINADTKLKEAEASDILETREYRIELMQAKYNLTLQQAEQVVQATNKIMQEIENLSTEDQIAKIEKFVLENTKKDKIEQAKAELEKTKAEIRNIEENTKNQGNERRVRTAEQVRKWIDGLISQGIKVGWLMLSAI